MLACGYIVTKSTHRQAATLGSADVPVVEGEGLHAKLIIIYNPSADLTVPCHLRDVRPGPAKLLGQGRHRLRVLH